MSARDLNKFYSDQIQKIMLENGLDERFGAEIKTCSTITEVFQALSEKGAAHVAVLTQDSEPITNMFHYIKEQLATKAFVPLALFFEKDEAPIFYA